MITIKSDEEVKIMREAGRVVGEVLQILRRGDEARRRRQGPRQARAQGIRAARRDPDLPRLRPAALPGDGLHLGQRGAGPRHPRRPRHQGRRHRQHRPRRDLQGLRRRQRHHHRRRRDYAGSAEADRRDAGVALARHPRRTAGERLGVVSNAIGDYIESQGYGVVRGYVGHGVGRKMHEEPQVPNYGPADRGPVLKKGMVLALEPMVTIGDYATRRSTTTAGPSARWTAASAPTSSTRSRSQMARRRC